MHGISVPGLRGRYDTQIAIMQHMGWGWRQLLECPEDLVDELRTIISSTNHWNATKKEQKPKGKK